MKKAITIVVWGLCFIVSGCYSNDDDDLRIISLKIRDKLNVINNENYVVGDTLYFELEHSRYLKEDGYSNLLDIFESTNADRFNYNFGLGKYSNLSADYIPVNIDSKYIFAEKGAVSNEFHLVSNVLNDAQNVYESKIGLILVEAGDFELNFDELYLTSDYKSNKITIEIRHSFTSNTPPEFKFTVTE